MAEPSAGNNDHWKTALLRSGMPLELSAARYLTKSGYSINADFHYSWSPSADHRNSAVDLHAKTIIPDKNQDNEQGLQTELLINCVSRPPKTAWLFLPDPNPSERSPVALGNAVRSVDHFSPFILSREKADAFESSMPACYRSIEINMQTGEQNRGNYMNGLIRLQNALPRSLMEKIDDALSGPREKNTPFLFCPILITNAPLYVIQKNSSPEDICNAGCIKDIADKTDRLILYADFTPEFKQRCMTEAASLKPHLGADKAMEIEMKKVRHFNSRSQLPFTIIEAFTSAEYAYLCSFFSQFIVCTHEGFARMVQELTEVFGDFSANRQPLY